MVLALPLDILQFYVLLYVHGLAWSIWAENRDRCNQGCSAGWQFFVCLLCMAKVITLVITLKLLDHILSYLPRLQAPLTSSIFCTTFSGYDFGWWSHGQGGNKSVDFFFFFFCALLNQSEWNLMWCWNSSTTWYYSIDIQGRVPYWRVWKKKQNKTNVEHGLVYRHLQTNFCQTYYKK